MSTGQKVLVTGGAGYIGSVLVRILLRKGYSVRIIDSLRFGGESLLGLLGEPGLDFRKGDITVREDLEEAVAGVDHVAHLAGIVGDPACAKEPELAERINLDASKELVRLSREAGVSRFVFASTCSNYGKSKDPEAFMEEGSLLNPVSHYARLKVAFEQHILEELPRTAGFAPISLRFSTVYGASPRMRFDLTVNEFAKELVMGRELVVFGEQFWRPYCHVTDLARSVVHVLEAPEEKVAYDVFNVGDTRENYTKQMLVDEMKRMIPGSRIKYVRKDEDPRDYRVSSEKIQRVLGFEITRKVSDGIGEVVRIISDGIVTEPDSPRYRNT